MVIYAQLYVDIHKWSSLHKHEAVRAHALERLVVQSGEGLCPMNALTIQIR